MTEATAANRAVELVIFDCDGVLTDGRLIYGAEGEAHTVYSFGGVKTSNGISRSANS